MTTVRLPGLVDPHVHLREPGAVHKEDFDSGTAAALAGGFTQVLAMPNTVPPITDAHSFEQAHAAAEAKARCDYGIYLGAALDNAATAAKLAGRACGLKMYLDQTYGPLRVHDLAAMQAHVRSWPADRPLAVHAEGKSLAAILLLAAVFDRSLHICHVSRRAEIELIRRVKERGQAVTCEVTPHHLFLTQADVGRLGRGRASVRPELATDDDRQALWEAIEVIDCFATDHAPHTLEEKDGDDPPPGFPGLETALGLMLTAVHAGQLSLDQVVERMAVAPRRIFGLVQQAETWVEIDPQETWEVKHEDLKTRSAWSPFESWKLRGCIKRVTLRGQIAYNQGQVQAEPGSGRDVRVSTQSRNLGRTG
jgi:carbamoyl-phosphate synthase/aspartate carbamoyltransferase/dihydroorotase